MKKHISNSNDMNGKSGDRKGEIRAITHHIKQSRRSPFPLVVCRASFSPTSYLFLFVVYVTKRCCCGPNDSANFMKY